MMRFFLLAAMLTSVVSAVSAATIPVTGTIRLPDGSPMQGRVRFTLSHPAQDVLDLALIVPQPVEFTVTNGQLPPGARIVPNDELRPENTYYVAEYFNALGQKVMQNDFVIWGSNFDIGSAIPTSATTSDISSSNINNIRICDRFRGDNAGAKIAACIADLPAAGGTADARGLEGVQTVAQDVFNGTTKPVTLLLGAGTYIWTVSFSPSSGSAILGLGIGATNVNYSGSGAWLDIGSGVSINAVRIADIQINVVSPAAGGIRIGRTSENFGSGLRVMWNLKNLYITGPGYPSTSTLPAGSFGISISAMLDSYMENLNILGFERASIIDRCGNNQWNRIRWQQYRFGPLISSKAGTGTASNGGSQDTFINPEFLGPSTTGTPGVDYGYTVEVQAQAIIFINALYETSNASQGLLHLMSVVPTDGYSSEFMDINGVFGSNVDKTMVFESGYNQPMFLNSTVGAAGWGAISFGTPYRGGLASKARFYGVNKHLADLIVAADPTSSKSFLDAPLSNTTWRRNGPVSEFTGIVRAVNIVGETIASDQTGKSMEIEYEDSKDTGVIRSYDRTTGIYKPMSIESATTRFGSRLQYNTEIALTDLAETPSVSGSNRFIAANSRKTSITNFANGIDGQMIIVRALNPNTTLVASHTLRLSGAADYVMRTDDTIVLVNNGAIWFELSRSVN